MRTILSAVMLCSFNLFAGVDSVIPKKTNQYLHYLYKNIAIDDYGENVSLKGPRSIFKSQVSEIGISVEIPVEEYLKKLQISQAVFEATTGDGFGVGTAFLVGENFVLSNRHVVQVANGLDRCSLFSINTQIPKREKIKCKKIHYCSRSSDFCLVEMDNFADGKKLSDRIQPLTLIKNVNSNSNLKTMIIGNSLGLGISAGSGVGISIEQRNNVSEMIHYNPTFGGSSGSPIMNLNGEVIGVNYAGKVMPFGNTYIHESDSLSNLAVPSDVVLKELKENIPEEILSKINRKSPHYIDNAEILNHFINLRVDIKRLDSFESFISNLKTVSSINEIRELDFSRILDEYVDENLKNLESSEKMKSLLMILLNSEFNKNNELLSKIKNIFRLTKNVYLFNTEEMKEFIDECLVQNDFSNRCLIFHTVKKGLNLENDNYLLSESQKSKLVEALTDIVDKDATQLLYDDFSARDIKLDFLVKNLDLVKLFTSCISSQEFQSFGISKYFCEKSWIKYFEAQGIKGLDRYLLMRLSLMLKNTDYELIENSFKIEVLGKDYFCLFGLRNCKIKKLEKIVREWKYSSNLSDYEIKRIAEVLSLGNSLL